MRLIQSDAIELHPWADDDAHDPLTTASHGPIAAFDRPALSTSRAQRPAPARQSLSRRLYTSVKARYFGWQLSSMRARMEALEAAMGEATQLALDMARRHQHSPALQQRRRAMRADHTVLTQEWLRVRQEIDNLQVAA